MMDTLRTKIQSAAKLASANLEKALSIDSDAVISARLNMQRARMFAVRYAVGEVDMCAVKTSFADSNPELFQYIRAGNRLVLGPASESYGQMKTLLCVLGAVASALARRS